VVASTGPTPGTERSNSSRSRQILEARPGHESWPRLKPGVVVHIHDIYLPREYDVGFFKQHKVFLNEQYLLQAFLTFNPRFEVLWAGHFMHVRHPERLKAAFASYRDSPAAPFSWWIRSKRPN
jgi:hypothetical protein